jgi:hypothetical protein
MKMFWMKEAMAIRRSPLSALQQVNAHDASHVDLDKCDVGSAACRGVFSLFVTTRGRMPSFLPGINWHALSSEKERYEARSGKRRRRAVSEPTPMDVDDEEGSRTRCSLCNGTRFSPVRRPPSDI